MKEITLFLSFALAGCIPDIGFKRAENFVDPQFQPYVHAFQLNYKGEWPPGLEVQFGQPEDHEKTLGDCHTESVNGKAFQYTIRIDESDWDSVRMYQREALIMHELGHCVLLREHLNTNQTIQVDDKDFECPVSWMTKSIRSEDVYLNCRSKLYIEFFGYQDESEIFFPNYKPRRPSSISGIFTELLETLKGFFQ